MNVATVDHVVLLSFGGPEGPDEVVPFLRRVTAGKGIPDERLVEVGRHYLDHFDGVSPINAHNRALVAALGEAFAARGWDVPIRLANRNSAPFIADVLADLGAGRIVVLTTSAYPSYSSCRQYIDDITLPTPVPGQVLRKVTPYAHHRGFAAATVAVTRDALHTAYDAGARRPKLAFVTHSIPTSMAANSSPTGDGYLRWHERLMGYVVDTLRAEGTLAPDAGADLVYCSRSGPPHVAWLDPDINDHIEAVAESTDHVVCVPFGFISDHMEVVYDLDIEAAATAEQYDIGFTRAATVDHHSDFIAALCDVVAAAAADDDPEIIADGECWRTCPAYCCPAPARRAPAADSHRSGSASAASSLPANSVNETVSTPDS